MGRHPKRMNEIIDDLIKKGGPSYGKSRDNRKVVKTAREIYEAETTPKNERKVKRVTPEQRRTFVRRVMRLLMNKGVVYGTARNRAYAEARRRFGDGNTPKKPPKKPLKRRPGGR